MKCRRLLWAIACLALLANCSSSEDSPDAWGDGGRDVVTDTTAEAGPAASLDGGLDPKAIKCRSQDDCAGGQICCSETDKFGTLCQAAPCGKTILGYPVQLCKTAAECANPGEVCAPFVAVGVPIVTCQAGGDAAVGSDGQVDAPAEAGVDGKSDGQVDAPVDAVDSAASFD